MFSYNKATLYGKSLVDYIWVKNKVDTQEEINSTLSLTYEPEWDSNTFLLANFNNTLDGGNIASVGDRILYWQIYKRKEGDATLHFVAKIPASQYSVYDFSVLNTKSYQYILFAETEEYISAPLQQSGFTNVSLWNWSLVGLTSSSNSSNLYYADTNNIWTFNTELKSGAMEQNMDKYTIENFTRYPKISSGIKNYLSGSITAFLNNPNNGAYKDSVEMYNKFIEFIADENPKLLRDRKGNGWIVATINNSMQYIDESAEQITSVSFNFTQINDFNAMNIIGG